LKEKKKDGKKRKWLTFSLSDSIKKKTFLGGGCVKGILRKKKKGGIRR